MKIFGLYISKEIYMPIIIIIVSIISYKVISTLINKAFEVNMKRKKSDVRKIKTINSVLSNIVKYIIVIFALLSILNVFGINTSAIIAGLGVASLVIGLAFQDILKDILAGASIIFENQFAIGDFVEINGFKGNIIALGLKTTKIKAYTGEIKIISNRNILEVTNYSINNTLAIVDIGVAYESNIDKVEKILKVCCATMKEKTDALLEEPVVLGVQKLDESSVIFRVSAVCKPARHFEVERLMNKEFKNTLDKNGIKIPYKQIEVHNEK